MKITKAHLREVVREETQNLLLERQLYRMIDEEAAKLGIVLTEELRESVMGWLRKHKRKLGIAAAGMGFAGFLHNVQVRVGELDAATEDRIEQIWQDAQAGKETKEGKLKALSDYLFSKTAAGEQAGNKWVWGEKGTNETFSSYTDEDGLTMVMPPEFSVMYQVYQDFENDQGPKLEDGDASPPAGDVVGSADYANLAKQKQFQRLDPIGGVPAGFIPMENLDPTMHMENSKMSPEQFYVDTWKKFIIGDTGGEQDLGAPGY